VNRKVYLSDEHIGLCEYIASEDSLDQYECWQEYIFAGCYPNNTASLKMLKKCGFRPHPDGNQNEKHYLTGDDITQLDFIKYNPKCVKFENDSVIGVPSTDSYGNELSKALIEQTDPHAHLHIIPRYKDEPFSGKGIRHWLKSDENMRPI